MDEAPLQQLFQLTKRECAVVVHLAKGMNNQEIAASLGISGRTVKAHLSHVMAKMDVNDRMGILAKIWGTYDPDYRDGF